MDLNSLKSAVAILDAIQGKPAVINGDIGRKVIVRSRDAGVIYGVYAGNDGDTVRVKNGRQLWKWRAADGISLIDVATFGVVAAECKFSTASADLTVFNACAVIDVTPGAAASIEGV